VSVGPEGDTERSSKTKIGELEVSIPVDEQILGLEISVEDSVGVAVVETLDELKGEPLHSQGQRDSMIRNSFRNSEF
jgi:hypothetical protein